MYHLERHQDPIELIEAEEGKLWSMFIPLSKECLERCITALKRVRLEHPGELLRNDETITLLRSEKMK
ncbi:MAG: hypothetical protein ACUVV4_02065 [Candidatus Bathyarchaeia archaeon]